MNENNKVALVTGAASGIGEATVRRLVADGCRVALLDWDHERLAALEGELPTGQVLCRKLDVADYAAVEAAVDATMAAFGRLDYVHSNAGITGEVGAMMDVAAGDLDRIFAVNVRGTFNTIRATAAVMGERGGSIVVTASASGLRPTATLGIYSASKFAVIGIAKNFAVELGPRGIRVNMVAPGLTDTPAYRHTAARRSAVDGGASAGRTLPLGRIGTAAEVANVVAWLFSDEARYVTGAIHQVDGGLAI